VNDPSQIPGRAAPPSIQTATQATPEAGQTELTSPGDCPATRPRYPAAAYSTATSPAIAARREGDLAGAVMMGVGMRYRTCTSSTSKTRTAFGGIASPAPALP
jgi:hypothetical protein